MLPRKVKNTFTTTFTPQNLKVYFLQYFRIQWCQLFISFLILLLPGGTHVNTFLALLSILLLRHQYQIKAYCLYIVTILLFNVFPVTNKSDIQRLYLYYLKFLTIVFLFLPSPKILFKSVCFINCLKILKFDRIKI